MALSYLRKTAPDQGMRASAANNEQSQPVWPCKRPSVHRSVLYRTWLAYIALPKPYRGVTRPTKAASLHSALQVCSAAPLTRYTARAF